MVASVWQYCLVPLIFGTQYLRNVACILENHYVFAVGPFQMSLLFSRTSELQEVGSALFNALLQTRIFKFFFQQFLLIFEGQLKDFGGLKFRNGLAFHVFLRGGSNFEKRFFIGSSNTSNQCSRYQKSKNSTTFTAIIVEKK